jgi:hypothetical protein
MSNKNAPNLTYQSPIITGDREFNCFKTDDEAWNTALPGDPQKPFFCL